MPFELSQSRFADTSPNEEATTRGHLAASPPLRSWLTINHYTGGPALLREIVEGIDGFAVFCFLVAVLIKRMGGAADFGLTTAAVASSLVLTPNWAGYRSLGD
jgi:hypothetical protein